MERIITDKAPAAVGPYSQAVTVGQLVYTSGILGIDSATGSLAEDLASQTACALRNLTEILLAAGSGSDRVVKTTCFLAEKQDAALFNEIYARFFTGKPARSLLFVSALPKGALVEIEAIAEV